MSHLKLHVIRYLRAENQHDKFLAYPSPGQTASYNDTSNFQKECMWFAFPLLSTLSILFTLYFNAVTTRLLHLDEAFGYEHYSVENKARGPIYNPRICSLHHLYYRQRMVQILIFGKNSSLLKHFITRGVLPPGIFKPVN